MGFEHGFSALGRLQRHGCAAAGVAVRLGHLLCRFQTLNLIAFVFKLMIPFIASWDKLIDSVQPIDLWLLFATFL